MSEEIFVPNEQSMQFRLDKVIEAVEQGILGEVLRQEDAKRRSPKKSKPHYNAIETEKAYAYYWRQFKEYEKLPIKPQLEQVLELFVDISCRFDPPTYSEEVYFYADELGSPSLEELNSAEPPFVNLTFFDSQSNLTLSQAKMMFLYHAIQDHMIYLLKMYPRKKKTNKKKNMDIEKDKVTSITNSAKGKFEEAVKKMNKEVYDDVFDCYPPDYVPEPPDEDFDAAFDDSAKVDLEPEEVPSITLKPVERKATDIAKLHLKLVEYLNLAKRILEIKTKEADLYGALGRLYDHIDKENGGYIDDLAIPPGDYEFSVLSEKWGLWPEYGKRKDTRILKYFLEKVNELTDTCDWVTKIGVEVEITEGWSWEPVAGIYPALVIMDSLLTAIRVEMRFIHRQALIVNGEDIPKHKFPKRTAYFDEEKDDVIVKREYVYDDDFDKSEYICPWDEIDEEPESNQSPKEMPHFNLDIPDDNLLGMLKELKEMEWKHKRLKEAGAVDSSITDAEWLYAHKGPGKNRKAPTGKLPWKAVYLCKEYVDLLFGKDKDYELAQKVFCWMDDEGMHDIKDLKHSKIRRNDENPSAALEKIAEIIDSHR